MSRRSRTDRPPAYQRHKGSGQARVRIEGRDIYLGPYGSVASRAEYDRIIGEWLAHGRRLPAAGGGAGPADLTVAELVAAYWGHVESYYVKDGAPTSEVPNIKLALRPLLARYGDTRARDFGPLALKSVREGWIDAGLVRTEINKRVGRLVRCFKWAVGSELIPPAVHDALRAVEGLRKGRSGAKEGQPVRPVPADQVEAVRPFVNRQVGAMIELQLLTGMRPGEVTILRTGDIDRSGDVWVYTPRTHKMEHRDRARRIYLGPRAQELLRDWLKADRDAFVFSPIDAAAEKSAARRAARKTPVQPSQQDRPRATRPKRAPRACYSTISYDGAIARGCRKAGIARWHSNQLRHSAATHLRREFGVDVCRVLLGHTSPIVTEIYAELDHEKAVEAVRKIG
jgi:integrase